MTPQIRTEVIKLTPSKAAQYLKNSAPNRTMQSLRVQLFAEIINDGYWQLTHQGIGFNSRNQLIDGQHRCKAVVDCGIAVPIMATWNLPDSSMVAIDRGKVRDDTDIVNLTGGLSEHITRNQTAVAKAMAGGFSGSAQDRLSGPRLTFFIVKHFDALMFVRLHGGSIPAVIKAPIARAWYTEDRERLAQFLDVVKRGVSESVRDSAAAKLALEYAKAKRGQMSASVRAEWYRKTECALGFFLEGRKLSSLKEVHQERYPLESDEEE